MNPYCLKKVLTATVLWALVGSGAWAEEEVAPSDLEALKRQMQEIISENRELTGRVRELEAEMTELRSEAPQREQAADDARKAPAAADDESEAFADATEPTDDETRIEELEERVDELETTKTANEDATRSIIRDAIGTLGSKINEAVTLGGTLEVLTGWGEDFEGQSDNVLTLNTAELDFEVQVNDWMLGSIILEYNDGTDRLFPTDDGNVAFVDRINIDTAYVTVGDPQRFPPFGTFGRMVVPFGISTGDPVADVLTIEDPLTIEVFETRQDALLFGFGFPTPAVEPATPPVIPPPVRPRVLNPLVTKLSRSLGWDPPWARPRPPTPMRPTPAPPLFNAGFYLFNGDTTNPIGTGWDPGNQLGATVGFRTRGECRRPPEQRPDGQHPYRWHAFCPWSIDVDVDFNRSVFDSQFLQFEYRRFLDQIGFVPGMAASVKSTLGPWSLVGEWNGAIDSATFTDDLNRRVSIRPNTWQVSLGYQFDWNPWVQEIGAQGDYLAVSYSESFDLGGVTRVFSDEPFRVGSVPRRRFLVSLGEWVLDGFRIAVEYSHIWDYPTNEGGTGSSANGVFTMFTYVW